MPPDFFLNKQSLQLLGEAYHFPDYYSLNLDSADEILEDLKEEEEKTPEEKTEELKK